MLFLLLFLARKKFNVQDSVITIFTNWLYLVSFLLMFLVHFSALLPLNSW